MSDGGIEKIKTEELKELEKKIFSNPQLQNIPQKQRLEITRNTLQVISYSKSHSGPLPDVETLQGYNEIIPNGGERLMLQVEKQGDHRRKLEGRVINWNNFQSLLGQLFGLIIAAGFLYACYELAMNGHDTVAGILGGTTIVSLVGIFVYGKNKQTEKF